MSPILRTRDLEIPVLPGGFLFSRGEDDGDTGVSWWFLMTWSVALVGFLFENLMHWLSRLNHVFWLLRFKLVVPGTMWRVSSRLEDCSPVEIAWLQRYFLSERNCSTCSLAILSENKDSEITARSVEQELFVYIFFTECVGLINYPWGRLSFGKIEILTWRAILEFTLWNLCLLFALPTMTWPRKDDADPNETFHKQAFPDAPQEGSGRRFRRLPFGEWEAWDFELPLQRNGNLNMVPWKR